MSSDRKSEIIDEEIIEENIDPKDLLKYEIFEKLKIALIDQKRLLGRFHQFCEEYTTFEYDEMGMNMEEADEVLRKANKIRDKFMNIIQENTLYIFENILTHTQTNIITFSLFTQEFDYKIILDISQDSFNLTIE